MPEATGLRGLLRAQLAGGLEPEPAAWALALGLWIGILPLLGVTTAACAAAGLLLGLNQPLLQAANFAAYPLQLLLLLPFYAAGARLFGVPLPPLTLGGLEARARSAPWDLARDLWGVGVHGVVVWALVGLAAVPALHLGLRAGLRAVGRRRP